MEIRQKEAFEITPRKRELEARLLKMSNMRIKRIIEKENKLVSDIGGKNMMKVPTCEASTFYK